MDAVKNEMTDLNARAMGIAARIWCDDEMSHLRMDEKAAMEIATIIQRVISNQFQETVKGVI